MNYIITALSLIVALFAWVSKILWSKEYREAKEEIIRLKDNQLLLMQREIDLYKELTPMKIQEYYISVKQQLEEIIKQLEIQLETAQNEINKKVLQIDELSKSYVDKSSEIKKIKKEKENIVMTSINLAKELKDIKETYKSKDSLILNIPKVDIKPLEELIKLSEKLGNTLEIRPSSIDKGLLNSKVEESLKNLHALINNVDSVLPLSLNLKIQ